MKKTTLVKTVLILSSLPLLAGCVERRVVYRDRPVNAAPPAEYVVEQPSEPPPLQVEVIPVAPDPTFIWVGGGWEWRGRWVWGPGRWAPRPHPGAVWVRGGWTPHHGHGHVWVGGHWR